MSQDQYSWVYKELVQGPDDVVGALAYVLYKQQKIAFLEKINTDLNREPSEDELRSFHTYTLLPETLQGFTDRAEALADQFLEIALATKLQQAETLLRQSVTVEEVKRAALDTSREVNNAKQVLESKLDAVASELNGKKGFWGWVRDVGGNLAVNFGTILLIGMMIMGYQGLAHFTGLFEKSTGVSAASNQQPEADPASIPVAIPAEASPK
ncbi:hypothetical protein [Janthinobacterium sp. B9-8]|uniref:hypothetical protein n=1 Tax=Janthinobacterium sp. B9-8 TaxID=1236179 RepID=UPI00061D18B5|nr:hypothetical protein [Janthinobacterium sp. B9-8]AMC34075.1 hypothetical protein VN23_05435 [Janthinobacterium sp. B9-8]